MSPVTSLPPVPDRAALEALFGRSLLLTRDWTTPELEILMAVIGRFAGLDYAGKSTALFKDELGWALFFDQSTRTKSAWAGACARLGLDPVIVDGSSTQVSHGETAVETGAMLGMNAHALGVRHDLIIGEGNRFMRDVKQGIDDYLAATKDPRRVPVVNLQCDIDHPTQTLADLMWIRECNPRGLQGRKIAISWAYSPSYAKPLSVAQGCSMLFTRFGADVVLAHPVGYHLMPDTMEFAAASAKASGGSFKVVNSMDEAFKGADIVYPKSWGPYDLMLQRVAANKAKDKARLGEIEQEALAGNAKHKDWICDENRMGLTRGGDALYMHPLPADIGDEVSHSVMRQHTVNVARQAQYKMYAIMALLAVAKVPNLAQRLEALAK